MEKIVAVALFGKGYKYAQFLPSFLRAQLNLFPLSEGWRIVILTDALETEDTSLTAFRFKAARLRSDTYIKLLNRYCETGLIFPAAIPHKMPKCRAMFWRLKPIFYHDARYVFCRDLDALPMPRDRAACEAFMESGCTVHTIHDHPEHIAIMGGLCGFNAARFQATMGVQSFDALLSSIEPREWEADGGDQLVLNRLIIRPNGPDLYEHSYAGWYGGYPDGRPARAAGQYICGRRSHPTPNVGRSSLSASLAPIADRLAHHLGSAGYDIDIARDFWDSYGAQAITKLLAKCEEGIL